MATTHELFHLRLFAGGIETQRIWLEEVFCNLASIAFVTKNQPELLKANDLLTSYHLQTNKTMLKYTCLETFEENRMKIVMEAPQNYGWYQFRFIDAANKLFHEGGEEVLKKLWNFLGEEKEKLSDEALKVKLSTEVHPYFNELIENW
ncbi:MAG TPA: hypothetical protein PKE63_00995 [Lacibacter sp.]|nr:hypothetical protein [Lacibacter sp.]HMP85817.1 hypothetical protein [Lacibacter sp.]